MSDVGSDIYFLDGKFPFLPKKKDNIIWASVKNFYRSIFLSPLRSNVLLKKDLKIFSIWLFW